MNPVITGYVYAIRDDEFDAVVYVDEVELMITCGVNVLMVEDLPFFQEGALLSIRNRVLRLSQEVWTQEEIDKINDRVRDIDFLFKI